MERRTLLQCAGAGLLGGRADGLVGELQLQRCRQRGPDDRRQTRRMDHERRGRPAGA